MNISCRLLCDILRDRIAFRREIFCLETKMLSKSLHNYVNFTKYSLYSENTVDASSLGSDLRQKDKVRGSTEVHLIELFIVRQIFIPFTSKEIALLEI